MGRWPSGIGFPFIVVALGVALVVASCGPAGATTGPAETDHGSAALQAASSGTVAPASSAGASAYPPSPSPSLSVSPSPAPSWAPVRVEPLVQVADLVAASADRAGIATDTAFTLRSLTAERADAMAARLTVEPAVELRVDPGIATAVVHPASSLTKGRLYRFTLRAQDGTLEGSWAFQVRHRST